MTFKFEMGKSMKIALIAVILMIIRTFLMHPSIIGPAAVVSYIVPFAIIVIAYHLVLNYWK